MLRRPCDSEYLASYHGFTRSVETLRQWMIGDALWVAKRARRKRAFQLRERRASVGELVQIDGSPHPWLEERGPRCALILFVDDERALAVRALRGGRPRAPTCAGCAATSAPSAVRWPSTAIGTASFASTIRKTPHRSSSSARCATWLRA